MNENGRCPGQAAADEAGDRPECPISRHELRTAAAAAVQAYNDNRAADIDDAIEDELDRLTRKAGEGWKDALEDGLREEVMLLLMLLMSS